MTTIEVILIVFQSLVGIVLTAAVPWAFMLERRLAHIEAFLKEAIRGELVAIRTEVGANREHLRRHSELVRTHDKRLMRVEQKIGVEDNSDG
jgi:hypothetical protein